MSKEELKKENEELKRILEDIEIYLRSYDLDKLDVKQRLMIDNVLLIKKGTIKVVRDDEA